MIHKSATKRNLRLVQFLTGLAAILTVLLLLTPGSRTEAQENASPQSTAGIYDEGQWIEMGSGSASGGGLSSSDEWSYSPSLAFGRDGSPIIAWCNEADGIHVQSWNGESWEAWGAGSSSGGGIVDNRGHCPWLSLATGSDGFPIVAWVGAPVEIYLRRWNGEAWVEMGAGSASGAGISDHENSFDPSLAVGPNGIPVIAWSVHKGDVSEIFVRRWNGVSWEEIGSESASGGGISNTPGFSFDPSLAVGPDGAPVVAWYDYSGSGAEIYLRRWNGTAWLEMGEGGVSKTPGYSYSPDLAIGPDGLPIITWVDDWSGNNEIYVRRWNGEAWVAMGAGSDSGGGISGSGGGSLNPSLALDRSGNPIIAWQDYSREVSEIYLRRWNGAAWLEMGSASASAGGITDNPGSSDYPQTAVGPDGTAVVAWEDYSDEGYPSDIYVLRFQPKGSYELRVEVTWQTAQTGLDFPGSDAVLLAEKVQLPLIISEFPPFTGPRELEPNDNFRQANGPLAFNQTYIGSFTDEADQNDYYFFKLPSAQTVSVRLTGIPLEDNLDLLLRDEAMEIIGSSNHSNNMDEEIQIDLQPGLYYVQIEYQ